MYFINNVQKRYGTNTILTNVTCELPAEGITVVMGPSGAGKSTLVRLLTFIEKPDVGSIVLKLGNRQIGLDDGAKWPTVTCVFQKQFLWPHLTLRENILLPIRDKATDAELRFRRVIDLFGMASFVDRFPNEVSGGEAQRAALARALVLDARVILIDEPHVGLDLEQQDHLNRHFRDLRQQGIALVVVTHSLDFARRYADNIVVVEAGSIAEIGSRAILSKPKSQYLARALGGPSEHD